MDTYKEFGDRLRSLMGKQSISICQGIVKSVEELTCTVRIDNIDIPDVRLRASMSETDREVVFIPKPGSAVIVGSLSGDLTELA